MPCGKYKLQRTKNWHESKPFVVAENVGVKLLWGFNVQCDNVTEARRPGIVTTRTEDSVGSSTWWT